MGLIIDHGELHKEDFTTRFLKFPVIIIHRGFEITAK